MAYGSWLRFRASSELPTHVGIKINGDVQKFCGNLIGTSAGNTGTYGDITVQLYATEPVETAIDITVRNQSSLTTYGHLTMAVGDTESNVLNINITSSNLSLSMSSGTYNPAFFARFYDKSSMGNWTFGGDAEEFDTFWYICGSSTDDEVVVVLNADSGYAFDPDDLPFIYYLSGANVLQLNPVLSNGNRTATFTFTWTQWQQVCNSVGSILSRKTKSAHDTNIVISAPTIADVPTVNTFDFNTDPLHCTWTPDPIEYEENDTGCTLVLTAENGYQFDGTPKIYEGLPGYYEYAVLSADNTVATFTFDESDLRDWSSESGGIYYFDIVDADCIPIPAADPDVFFSVWLVDKTILETINDAIFITPSGDSADALGAIISLKQFYVNISADGYATLRTGKWTYSGTTCDYKGAPWKVLYTIGDIVVPELDESAIGYAPYVAIEVYLPFCGYVTLDANKVIGKTLRLKYNVDVIGGKCLALIYVIEDNVEILVEQKVGVIADELPFSNYLQGLRSSYAVGVESLGEMTPSLVISYQDVIGGDGHSVDGYNTDEMVTVGSCNGYVKFKKVVVNGSASGREKNMIEQLLMEGVIV